MQTSLIGPTFRTTAAVQSQPWPAVLASVAGVGLAGFALGMLTTYGQSWLPGQSNSLANSVSPWVLAAFVLAWTARGPRQAATSGALVLVMLEFGYVVGAYLRGYPSAGSTVAFWVIAGLLVGPMVGLAAHWVRFGSGTRAAVGIGCLCGVLIGEGSYTLIRLQTPTYGYGEIAVGILLLWFLERRRFTGLRSLATAIAVTAVLAAAFVAVY